jgi:hypothetical protein
MSTTKPPSYDDRFVVPLEPSRRGAHRARTSPVASALPVIAVLTTVFAVIVLGWILFGGQLFGGQGQDTTAAEDQAPSVSESAQPPQEETTSDPVPSENDVPADRTASVTVLNSTETSGLARNAVTALEDDGWSNAEFSYDSARSRTTTVVYYADEDQESTAQALVDDLGVGEIEQSPEDADEGIVVILGTDYTS